MGDYSELAIGTQNAIHSEIRIGVFVNICIIFEKFTVNFI